MDSPCFNYENYLRCSRKFENPNYDILYTINDLNVHDNFTMMSALKYEFPQKDYAKELRQVQASRWAFRYELHNFFTIFYLKVQFFCK